MWQQYYMKLTYENCRKIEGSFIWNVTLDFLSNQDLKVLLKSSLEDKKLLIKLVKKYGGEKLFIDSGYENKDKFFSWFSRIKEWNNQNNVTLNYSIPPTKSSRDRENDNLIDFFDFSDSGKNFQLRIDFTFDSYETLLEVDSDRIKKYHKNSSLYKRYVKSEKYLEQTKEIKNLALKIVGKEKDHLKQARRIFDWILNNISYKYPPEKRGVISTLKNKCGDCGEFNHIFITLCRIRGIPARSVLGMWAIPEEKKGYHAWAEFYIEGVGWIPVDSSVAEGLKNKKDKKFITFMKKMNNPLNPEYYFSNLDNNRIIFSKGENILLKNCPKKLSEFEMMEGCRSAFMQPASFYPFIGGDKKGIFILSDSSELVIL